jgi:hypothetical protein
MSGNTVSSNFARNLECELNEAIEHLYNAIDREDYGPIEWEAWNKRAIELVKRARAAAMPNSYSPPSKDV